MCVFVAMLCFKDLYVCVTMLCESPVCVRVSVRVVHDNVVCVKVCDNAVSLQNSCV